MLEGLTIIVCPTFMYTCPTNYHLPTSECTDVGKIRYLSSELLVGSLLVWVQPSETTVPYVGCSLDSLTPPMFMHVGVFQHGLGGVK